MLLGFKKKFAPKIETGVKIHTVRNFRKVTPKINETLYMYTGLRTKNCELISNKEKLKLIQKVSIFYHLPDSGFGLKIYVDQRLLSKEENLEFAINDGFEDIEDFIKWWLTGYDSVQFIGELFHWTDFKY